MAYEPVLTPYMDSNPMPRVEVLFSSLAPATARLTVYRRAEGREYVLRGGLKSVTTGAFTRIDFEIPFGIEVTYLAEMFDASGISLGFTGQTSIKLHCDECWVHNPLDPQGGVRVTFEDSAAQTLKRNGNAEIFYPQGRRVGVLIGGGTRGVQGVALDCVTFTIEEADRLAAMFGTYSKTTVPILCIRLSSSMWMRLPRPFFAAVTDAQEVEFNNHMGGETIRWAMTGDEVSPPSAGLFVPLLTRRDINAYYLSRAAANADNSSRLALNRRYDLAGTGA